MSILAIDFGGTRLRVGWFDDDMRLIERHETLSLVHEPQEAVISRLIETAKRVVPEAAKIRAVGISAPGPLNAAEGVILHAETLPGWYDIPLAQIVSRAFGGVRVFMNNDANLAALAEFGLGAGRDCDPMIYMTISTGIGGGAIINGKLFTGWRGLAIEPGHQRFLLPNGEIRRLEELASGTALGQIAQQKLRETKINSTLRDHSIIDGKAVGEAALQGDKFAEQIITEAGQWLGLGLVNLLHLFNPRAIVLGGSVTLLGDLLFIPARDVIRQNLTDPNFYSDDLIRHAQLGDDVCLFGAALYAIEHT